MTRLIVRHPQGTLTLDPGHVLRIGRDDSADLTLKHPEVSRRHAVIYWADGWCLADEGSTNGTHVDGAAITSTRLGAQTDVTLGALGRGLHLGLTAEMPSPAPIVAVPGPGTPEVSGETVLSGARPQPFREATPTDRHHEPRAGSISIGKASDNDIVLTDVHVSRRHTRVTPLDGGFLVEDLNSLNGTYLNAVPVQRAFMTDQDILTVGNSDFVRVGERLMPRRAVAPSAGGLRIDDLAFAIKGGRKLIDGVSLTAARGTLTAVIGPSGAGKSTFSRLLAGVTQPSRGQVRFDDFDLQHDYQAVKSRIGLVPQDDVVHRQISTRRALRYAASLRLPDRLPARAKSAQVDHVVAQLGLTAHSSTRIEKLSGGQRKRASVAMELLTEPSLLVLDEPTSGLDPALDRQVMTTLRELADGDRTVFVITHSVAYLGMCDQVVVLAPGGLPAYVGPPSGVLAHFETEDWGDIFGALADDPQAAAARWRQAEVRRSPAPAITTPAGSARRQESHSSGWWRQFWTLAKRQANLMFADRGYTAFLAALPFVVGLMPFVVPGDSGLTPVPENDPKHAGEPVSVLSLLIIGATFMGISMSIRDLIGERAIYLRERAVGLFPSAYLAAKLAVYGVVAALSTVVLVFVATWVKPGPETGVMGFGAPAFELMLPLFLTTWVGAALGLAVSSFVTSNDQVMPVLIVVLMVQLVLHGGLIPVIDDELLNPLSWLVPGRWGYAAAASGIDINGLLVPGQIPGSEPTADPLWDSEASRWLIDMGVLAAFGVVFAAATAFALRRSPR